MPYGFWNDPLPLSTNLSCHDLSANPLSETFPHLWIIFCIKSSKLNLPIWLLFHLNLIKTISAFYSSPWRFTKELPFLSWFLPPNLFPFLVLWTLNQDPWRSTGLQFKIFKLYLLQVWTRFVKFGEIHSNLSPKILSKIRQPLGALSGHLTKSQPQEKFSACQIILSNTCRALSKSGSENSENSSVPTVVFFRTSPRSRQ